jgi:hypothetical protein
MWLWLTVPNGVAAEAAYTELVEDQGGWEAR